MSFPRYPRYKPSGVEWLGEVPEQWDIVPLYRVATERGEPNIGMKEDNLLSLSYGQIVEKDITSNDGLLPASFETYQVVHQGDIVLRLTDLQNDKRSLRSAIVCDRGIITSAYLALMPRRIAPEFLSHLMRAYDLTKVFYSMGGGLRQSMKFEDLKRMPILLPGPTEQMAIASFLDRETAKIDGLVEEQKRLIDLLKEKRQAVITQAVTKGLNPNAPMKPSGIEWLGDVPAHWRVVPIGHLVQYMSYGFTNPMPTEDDGPYMLTANDIDYGAIRYNTARRTSHEAFDQFLTPKSKPVLGDVLVTKDGTLGRTAVHDGQQVCINQSVALLRPELKDMSSEFMGLALLAGVFQDRMIYEAGGTTIKHIYISRLAKMPLVVPPLDEQGRLVEFASQQTQRLDDLINESQSALELLQERRSVLISSAVTGKIDVRGFMPASATENRAPQRLRANA